MLGLLMAAVLVQAGAQPAPEKGVLGDWVGPTQSVVRVYECGSAVCLKIVRMPPHPPSPVDGHNPDQTLRNRPLCGLDIGTGFRREDAEHLVDGKIYDPTAGKTYKGTVTAEGSDLKLHGYIGISLFGRTETWTRIAPVKACAQDPAR